MAYDSIIFDLDGTLWDATPASTKGWNEAAAVLGSPHRISVDDIRRVSGNPQNVCIDLLFPKLSEQFRNTYELFDAYEEQMIRAEGGVLYENVAEFLPQLAAKYPLFIVSNCEDWYLDLFFSKYPLQQYFKDADCFGKSQVSKTDMMLNLKQKYALSAPVYVGDAPEDETATLKAGFDFIHAKYGFGARLNSEKTIHRFVDLQKFLPLYEIP